MRLTLLTALILLAGCRHGGSYVWADQYASAPRPAEYQIVEGDLLFVRVLGHDELSGRARVRSDGRISVPFQQDVPAAGLTPAALAQKLTAGVGDYVTHPVVTVTVDEARPMTVSVTGEVMRPGVYVLEAPAGVLQALASAGGLSQFAKDDQIYVLRRRANGEPPERIRFRYESLAHAEGGEGAFTVQRNDLIVVE